MNKVVSAEKWLEWEFCRYLDCAFFSSTWLRHREIVFFASMIRLLTTIWLLYGNGRVTTITRLWTLFNFSVFHNFVLLTLIHTIIYIILSSNDFFLSSLALIRLHKTFPAASYGSVITISFRFKETCISPLCNLTVHFTLEGLNALQISQSFLT